MKAEHRPPKDPGSCRVKTKTPPEGSKSPQRQRPESLTSTVKRFPVRSFPVSEFSQNLWEQLCDWQPRWTHIQQTGYRTDELSLHNDTTATLDDNNNNNNSVFGTSCLKTSSSWAPWWPLQVVGGVKLSEINRNKQISIFLKKTLLWWWRVKGVGLTTAGPPSGEPLHESSFPLIGCPLPGFLSQLWRLRKQTVK